MPDPGLAITLIPLPLWPTTPISTATLATISPFASLSAISAFPSLAPVTSFSTVSPLTTFTALSALTALATFPSWAVLSWRTSFAIPPRAVSTPTIPSPALTAISAISG
jgi:hypothetical protein